MKRLVGAILTAALTVACGFGAAAEKPESITVAYFPEWPTANQVAQAERWYDEEMGLEVQVAPVPVRRRHGPCHGGRRGRDLLFDGRHSVHRSGVRRRPPEGGGNRGVLRGERQLRGSPQGRHRQGQRPRARGQEDRGAVRHRDPLQAAAHSRLSRRRHVEAGSGRHGVRRRRKGTGPRRSDHGVRVGRRAPAHAGQEPGPDERPGADEDRDPDIRRGRSNERLRRRSIRTW